MSKFTQYQTATAIPEAAKNPGGIAGAGAGIGAGLAIGQQMAGAMNTMGNNMNAGAAGAAGAVPPPLPQSVNYFVAVNNQQSGPFDLNNIRNQVVSGAIARNTLIWKQGMANWAPAEQVPEVAALFANVLPPIPGQ